MGPMGWKCTAVLAGLATLGSLLVPCGDAVRIKVPSTVCGRIPNTYLCDAVPVGFKGPPPPASQEWEDYFLDNGKGRTPSTCIGKSGFCPYGDVTYGFGRNQFAQLGTGDRKDRTVPTTIPTAYAKVGDLRSGDHSNILLWEGKDQLYSWGRDEWGQLGQGPTINDTLPNRIFMQKPVLIAMGGQHTLATLPPLPANMFDYDDFAGKKEEFVHYGDSSQPIAPPDLCPRCIPWEEGTPVPSGQQQKYAGRACQKPPWSEASGVSIVGEWCFVLKGPQKPCALAEQAAWDRAWWIVGCKDTARFELTKNPPARLSRGAVWRRDRVQVYQAWRMSVFFRFDESEKTTMGGNGIVVAIQNNGIDPEDNPLGGTGRDMGIARSTRTSFNEGIPNSFAVEVRSVDNNGAIEIRGCYGGAYSTDNSLPENARCQIGISEWKPDRLCTALDPGTCCTDVEIRDVNKCFKEDIKDGAPHQLTIEYSPYSMSVFLDDPRYAKIKVDVDIRKHINSYECQDGPNKGKRCKCDGSDVCGDFEDTAACMDYTCAISGMAWVGFTSATGDAFSVHKVESWKFLNLGQDGALTSFGRNLLGQLGLANNRDRDFANLVSDLDGTIVQDASAGKTHSIVLTAQGQVYTWGANHFGQLGQGDTVNRNIPQKLRVLDSLKMAAELGDPCVCTSVILNCQKMPPVKPCMFEVVKVSAGAYHSLAVVKRDNDAHEIWGWGDNSFGQLGCIELFSVVECPWNLKPPGTMGNWPTPEVIAEDCSGTNPRCMTTPRKLAMFDPFGRSGKGMVFNFHSLSSGAYHNVLITKACPTCPLPSLCKNTDVSREDCDCDAGARTRPNVPLLWIQESADCIAKDLEIFAWGANTRGQLGNNCSNNAHHQYAYMGPHKQVCPDSPIPIRLNSPREIHLLPYYPDIFPYRSNPDNPKLPIMTRRPKTIITGGFHNLLVFDDASIIVWGHNYFGQLGLGDNRRRIYPVPLTYFKNRLVPAPNLSPRDGAGDSQTTVPQPVRSAQRNVKVVSAGEFHSIVSAECIGAGFEPDGSCNCRFGWKGIDCNIQCNGGANNTCSGKGTFDSSNRRGDRVTCAAYIEKQIALAKESEDKGLQAIAAATAAGLLRSVDFPIGEDGEEKYVCKGLKSKKAVDPSQAGCPGSMAGDACPNECAFCDEEMYDCENDGSCVCLAGYTGPDCGFHCVPNPPKYNFMAIAGGAICECERCYTGTYCDIRTCPDEANSSTTQSTDKGTTQVLPGAGASSAATGSRWRLSLTVQNLLWLAAVLVAMALAHSIGS